MLAGGLDEFHAIGHRNGLREALDDIVWPGAADEGHRPVRVPGRLFSVRGAVHVRDAPKTDRFGWLHARFEQPDSEVADVHGASERRQVHENQTIPDRDGVRSAISKRNERAGGLPLQLALLGYGKLFRHPTAVRRGVSRFRVTQRLNRTINIHEQRECALRENDDALPVNRSKPIRHLVRQTRVIVLSAIVEFHVSVDRHDIAAPAEGDSIS